MEIVKVGRTPIRKLAGKKMNEETHSDPYLAIREINKNQLCVKSVIIYANILDKQ